MMMDPDEANTQQRVCSERLTLHICALVTATDRDDSSNV